MSKCKHRNGVILASAYWTCFEPDQEPFTPDIIECAGVSEIMIEGINIAYCPRCNCVKWIEVVQGCQVETIDCTPENRCKGHL